MAAARPDISLAGHRQHWLHDPARHWGQTNCYVDLWIELLHALGHAPEAALGFAAGLDFEGDQFTFFKFPQHDLEQLFGVKVQELAVYDTLEAQVLEQVRRGRFVLVEVDGFYLPDTQDVSYQLEHTKTTVGINAFEPDARRMTYFHNAGFYALEGDDFDAALRRLPTIADNEDVLFPYAEFVKDTGLRLAPDALRARARALTRTHVAGRPAANPLLAFAAALDARGAQLAGRPPAFFHKYAFNTLRQLGAAFELFGSHLLWLNTEADPRLSAAATDCDVIAAGAKTLQFQMARAFARNKTAGLSAPLGAMAQAWDRMFDQLDRTLAA